MVWELQSPKSLKLHTTILPILRAYYYTSGSGRSRIIHAVRSFVDEDLLLLLMYELSYFLGVLMPKKKTVIQKKQTVQKKIKPVITSKTMKTKTKRKPAQSKTVAPVKKAPSKKVNLREKKFQEIRKKLLAQKKSLLIGAIEAMNNELVGPTVFPDLGDQATAEMDRNFMLRLRGRERKLLTKIEEAIERIEQHIFGLCDKCGDEIAMRRLEARPVTTMCIECKILQEEEEKLREP